MSRRARINAFFRFHKSATASLRPAAEKAAFEGDKSNVRAIDEDLPGGFLRATPRGALLSHGTWGLTDWLRHNEQPRAQRCEADDPWWYL